MFKPGSKGIINFVEAITVIIIVLISFAILFPGINFKSGWNDALAILSARDAIITMDRLNLLYLNSFSASSLQNFIDTVMPENRSGYVVWSSVEGTFKNSIVVACNCTSAQIENLTYWTNGMTINGRLINFTFFNTSLQTINPSDVLLIWNNIYLDDPNNSTLGNLTKYVGSGNGIVEMNDFTDSSQLGLVQSQIFGIANYTNCKFCGKQTTSDYFYRQPDNSSDIIYGPYKYFYHVPDPLKTYELKPSSAIPLGSGLTTTNCDSQVGHGNFLLNNTAFDFWICNSTTTFFATDASNNLANVAINTGGNFSIRGYNFTLQYINDPQQIGVSFGLNYQFADFLISWNSNGQSCPTGNAWGHYYGAFVTPIGSNSQSRILVNSNSFHDAVAPVVVLNNSGGRTAWIADFSNSPAVNSSNCVAQGKLDDDDKFLLASLLLWASNKQQFSIIPTSVKAGFLIPYVNVQDTDTYEVYKFNLGLGSPFGS